MTEYDYAAYQGPHARIEGRLQAESEDEAAASLLASGLQPVEIKPVRGRDPLVFRLSLRRKLTHGERALLARQLGDLVASGMPLLDALQLLQEQAVAPAVKVVLSALEKGIRGGGSLADAMASLPGDFGEVHVSLARAGEGAGFLITVLTQIATLEEREQEMRGRLQAALLYPTITAMVGLGTILVILNFVIPRLSSIFGEMGQSLPLITRALLNVSSGAQWIWRHGLLILLILLLSTRLLRRSEGWRLLKDRLVLRLPRLGHLVMTLQVARFTGILGSLLRNGVSMVPALAVTAETLENRSVRHQLKAAMERVNQGERLGGALEKEMVFTRTVTGMIAVGETTGKDRKSVV